MSVSLQSAADGTYGEILVGGSPVAKFINGGNAIIPGLVGTVSQLAGVPTGAVVEQGSNANGRYVRFADGTQICTGALTFIYDNSQRLAASWTPPAIYVTAHAYPVGLVTAQGNVKYNRAVPGGGYYFTGSPFTLRFWATGTDTFIAGDTVADVSVIAIGRWY